jgi:hypothetical protein
MKKRDLRKMDEPIFEASNFEFGIWLYRFEQQVTYK